MSNTWIAQMALESNKAVKISSDDNLTSEVNVLSWPQITWSFQGHVFHTTIPIYISQKQFDLIHSSWTGRWTSWQLLGESEYGSDGWIVRATQISPKCWKIATLFSVCICGLYRWLFDTILRWSTFVHILFVQVFRFLTSVMLFFGFTMKPPTIVKRTISLNNCSRLQWDA